VLPDLATGDFPMALMATTLKMYFVPLPEAPNVHEVMVVVQLYLAGEEVT